MTYKMPERRCDSCGGSGWVPGFRTQTYKRYIGDFTIDGKDKWSPDGPYEMVTEESVVAEPCPECNKLARAAYEDGRLAHLLAHRNDPPDEEEIRRRNIEKAKEKWEI